MKVLSPTRVDLAGGTLDCWPLYLLAGPATTVNLSISIQTGVELEPHEESHIHVDMSDLGYKKTFDHLDSLLTCSDSELNLLRSHVAYWRPDKGFSIRTWSESPVGGGLGGSSSLSISLLRVFAQWQRKTLALKELVSLASNIEAQVLRAPTGTQDYIPAASPGLNLIHYTVEGFQVEKVEFPLEHFSSRLLVVYTGRPHHSGINNWDVIKKAVDGDRQTLSCLRELAVLSEEMVEVCRHQRWEELGGLFLRETEARLRLSPGFSSPEIEQLKSQVLQAGAEAVKICGAGGGGCVLVWLDKSLRAKVADICKSGGFQVLDAKPIPMSPAGSSDL